MPPTPSKLESVLELSDSNGDTALSSALRLHLNSVLTTGPTQHAKGLPRWTPSVSSFHMPKLLNPSNSRKKNVAMDTIWPWAYAVAQNVQRNGWNINVHIAM